MTINTVPPFYGDLLVDKRSVLLERLNVVTRTTNRLGVKELHSSQTNSIPYLNRNGDQVGYFYIPSSSTNFQPTPWQGLSVQLNQKKEAAKALLLCWLKESEDPEQKASLEVTKQDIDEHRTRKLFSLE